MLFCLTSFGQNDNNWSTICKKDLDKNDSFAIYPGCENEKNNKKLKACFSKKSPTIFKKGFYLDQILNKI